MTDFVHSIQLADHAVRFADVGAATRPGRTPLVLLHGGAVDHRMWHRQLDAFPERRIVAPDARGHGGTSDADRPHRLVDDVTELLDALDINKAAFAGVSMGGGTAVDFALENPDRCAGLIVTGTGTSEPEFSDPWALEAFEDWARAAAAGDAGAWVSTFMRFAYGPHRTRADLDPMVVDLVERMANDTLAMHLRLDDTGVPQPPIPPTQVPDTWQRVPEIEVPVLALNGALDGPDHLRNGQRLADLAPHGRYEEIDGAAHYPNLEHPAEYGRIVRDFLADHVDDLGGTSAQ